MGYVKPIRHRLNRFLATDSSARLVFLAGFFDPMQFLAEDCVGVKIPAIVCYDFTYCDT